MDFTDIENNGYRIVTDNEMMDVEMIHHFISTQSYWAQNIPKETVAKSIRNSFCFGIFLQNKQVGFARLITDKATFAYLADVFVLPEHRGKGLSKWLMNFIHHHPELQELRGWLLRTKDAHGLYEQFGWNKLNEEQVGRYMNKHNPDVYRKRE